MESTPENTMGEVWYLRTWGTFHLVVGIIFSLIFILGSVVVKDYTFLAYLILSGGLIYMGINRLRKPYLLYSETQILIRGTFGEVSRTYEIMNTDEIKTQRNSIFLNGKKLRFNAWFTNRHQYKKMIDFYSGKKFSADELQD